MSSEAQAQPRHLVANGRRLSFAARPLDSTRGDNKPVSKCCLSFVSTGFDCFQGGEKGQDAEDVIMSEAAGWVLAPRVHRTAGSDAWVENPPCVPYAYARVSMAPAPVLLRATVREFRSQQ